jgi:hypothetical protein
MTAPYERFLGARDAPRCETIEWACIAAIIVTVFALALLLPYDDVTRSVLCFKLYAGHGCAY